MATRVGIGVLNEKTRSHSLAVSGKKRILGGLRESSLADVAARAERELIPVSRRRAGQRELQASAVALLPDCRDVVRGLQFIDGSGVGRDLSEAAVDIAV